jgi:hypothetical protein
MPTIITKGAKTAQGYGFAAQAAAAVVPNYIEDVFSTYLYTGTGSTQTITNGINLSGNGGLTWIKSRSAATDHKLTDTVRGATKAIISNTTAVQTTDTTGLTAFGTTGFTIGADANYNTSAATFASWTFRKQAKFFDIVTYTGTGTDPQTISHNLGSAPGCMIVKKTNTSSSWYVYHIGTTSPANSRILYLDLTNAENATSAWNAYTPTSTNFQVAGVGTNASGATYVAYLFASNAGGFGSAGTDNVITCGSYTSDVSGNATINLGYEPQWVMVKCSSTASNWFIWDTMRGLSLTSDSPLYADTSSAESTSIADRIDPTATGFNMKSFVAANAQFIYIAIRRGPMATPTLGTSVFNTNVETTTTNPQTLTTGFPVGLNINTTTGSGTFRYWVDRLRGGGQETSYVALASNNTNAEFTAGSSTSTLYLDNNTGFVDYGYWNTVGATYWSFQRAPSFFDEVCYTGTGSATTFNHNLGAVPELMIVKTRSGGSNWAVYSSAITSSKYLSLNRTDASTTDSTYWNSTTPTSTVFTVGTAATVNSSGSTYVSYLFATLASVSKVGTFTGTGGTQTINCGFGAGGARFLLVKRTDSTGNWYVFDSANGFTSSSSPYLLMNSTAAQTTGNNGCYAASTGFTVTSTASATVNVNGASYIFLAIA